MPTELCITYPEMYVFSHINLAIVSRFLMPYCKIICIASSVVHLHLTVLSDIFKCLMRFTNHGISSIIERGRMTVSN